MLSISAHFKYSLRILSFVQPGKSLPHSLCQMEGGGKTPKTLFSGHRNVSLCSHTISSNLRQIQKPRRGIAIVGVGLTPEVRTVI